MVGSTATNNFPTLNAYDSGYNGGDHDPFVTKLDTTLSGIPSLVYSTYLGGTLDDQGHSITLRRGEIVDVTGNTESTNFPTLNAYDSSHNGGSDAFVTRIDTTKSGAASLLYSTYLGGSSYDYGESIGGVIYLHVTGRTESTNFPTLNAYDSSYNGSTDVFVAMLDRYQSGTASLLYSTYLGGSGWDVGNGIAADSEDYAYVTGSTSSTDFPTTLSAYDSSYNGSYDAFVTELGRLDCYLPIVVKTF